MGTTPQTYYKAATLVEKADLGDGVYEFVASDETVDRYGDIVRVKGWELQNYRKNPVVLFGHQHSNPVGLAQRVWIEGTKLMVRIKLAEEGTSDFIDTLRKLVAQKIVRAVSVGFRTTEPPNYLRDEQNDRITGLEFIGQELLENSLVTVPANPMALSTAKSMGISEEHLRRIFSDKPRGAFSPLGLQRAALELAKLGASSRKF